VKVLVGLSHFWPRLPAVKVFVFSWSFLAKDTNGESFVLSWPFLAKVTNSESFGWSSPFLARLPTVKDFVFHGHFWPRLPTVKVLFILAMVTFIGHFGYEYG